MSGAKEIKGRIKSVKNTGKITKAMELISTVKMKKAQEAVLGSRPFALEAIKIFSRMTDTFSDSIYFREPKKPTEKELLVIIGSNKGLCGGYNVNIFRKLAELQKETKTQYDYITIGKKAREFVARTGGNLVADFSDRIFDTVELSDTRLISRDLVQYYCDGVYDAIHVVYNYYNSAISQVVCVERFLHIEREEVLEFLRQVVWEEVSSDDDASTEYVIEPNKQAIIDQVIPLVLDVKLYQIVLEAKASEHAARMVAMKNAKDNAGKKVETLTLQYNKARQANITKEISEIVSGVESMKDV